MTRRAITIGKHPIAGDLVRQYEDMDYEVERQKGLMVDGSGINDYDELCLPIGLGEDNKAIAMLGALAEQYDLERHEGRRLACRLLVQKNETLRMLQTCDLSDDVKEKIDVYPFTMEDIWSRSLVLDYEPITIHSNKHVHLVIFGMGEVAETMAIQTAHRVHYLNYEKIHATPRIAMIS